MKRAAGQIRKGRRKASDKESNDEFTFHDEPQPVRRKPTAEEAALTAKNYRLAKELVRVQSPDFRFVSLRSFFSCIVSFINSE